MVDFQSRDTRRDITDEENGDEGSEAEEPDAEEPDRREEPDTAGSDTQPVEGDPESGDRWVENPVEKARAATDANRNEQATPDRTNESESPNPVAGNTTASSGDPLAGDDAEAEPVEGAGKEADTATQRPDGELGHAHGDGRASGNDHTGAHGHDHGEHSHGHGHAEADQVGVAVVTVSSSRTREDDPSGDVIQSTLAEAGHDIVTRGVVRDDRDEIQSAVVALVQRGDVDAVVTTGGTGVTPDDVTVEAVSPLFDTELPGFGELFRILSYEDVGTKALASRAKAGIADGSVVFCLPGSEAAARLGVTELVVEEVGHLAGLAQRDE